MRASVGGVTALHQRRLAAHELVALLTADAAAPVQFSDEQRSSLAGRFRAVGVQDRLRVDAWSVEAAGAASSSFHWTPRHARRAIGRGALNRVRLGDASTAHAGVLDEVDELYVRAAAGYARAGSLAHWISGQRPATVALVRAEAVTWTSTVLEILEPLAPEWNVATADAFYDVAAARVTLRGARDVVVPTVTGRQLLRVRSGQPGKCAGPGLRADLVIDGLSDSTGRLAERIVGLWPDAGVVLSVEGTLEDARAGARDLVRTAMVQQRLTRPRAA